MGAYENGVRVDTLPTALPASRIANRTRSIFIPIDSSWTIISGTPDIALRNSTYMASAHDPAATEGYVRFFTLPKDFVSWVGARLWWTNLGAGSGNVVWRISLGNGGDGYSQGFTNYDATTAAPAQNVYKLTSRTDALLPNAEAVDQIVGLAVQRIGGDAADTLANDAGCLGIFLDYTADM